MNQPDKRGQPHTVSQMLEENREVLGMKVIAVMVQRYGVLPRDLWDLNSISDMGAGRGITYSQEVSKAMFKSILGNERYKIVDLTIGKQFSQEEVDLTVFHEVELPATLRQLKVHAKEYDFPLGHLPESLQELTFDSFCNYNQPLLLPKSLRKLRLGGNFNTPIELPPELVELYVGSRFNQHLVLPQRLRRLFFWFNCPFNFPLALPPSLLSIRFGEAYNQATILPSGIEEVEMGEGFTHDLSFPDSVRKIEWGCNRPIRIPEGVTEIRFGYHFNQPVTLPTNLKKATFEEGSVYSHPLRIPSGLEELFWSSNNYEGLVLPDRLRKLIWASACNVRLPLGLKELVVSGDAPPPFALHEGLLKVTFASYQGGQYTLPESVQEVNWLHGSLSGIPFTHPSTLPHLIVESFTDKEVDLSNQKVHKLTLGRLANVKCWPQGLQEVVCTAKAMDHPLRVPKGCRVLAPGGVLPANVIME